MASISEKGASYLSKQLNIGGLTAKNRFCIQPMECGDADDHGLFRESAVKRYSDYARGGAGIVVMESVTTQYESRSTKHQLMLDAEDADCRLAWEYFMKNMKRQFPETVFLVQLNHAGEFSSDEFSKRVCVKPHPAFGGQLIDADYVDQVIGQYIRAARFLYDIGCDGVDLKFCHGYLGSQILRPYNDRDWKYGGSWQNRSRFAFDLCEGVRKQVPDHKFLVGAKVSVYEGMTGGQGHAGAAGERLDMAETLDLCKGLEARGADYFIESLGNAHITHDLMAPQQDTANHVYLHLAASKLLRENLNPKTAVIGGGLSVLGAEQMRPVCEKSIAEGIFDAAALGRQALADPYLPEKYLNGREQDVNWCKCCGGCGALLMNQKPTHCVMFG